MKEIKMELFNCSDSLYEINGTMAGRIRCQPILKVRIPFASIVLFLKVMTLQKYTK